MHILLRILIMSNLQVLGTIFDLQTLPGERSELLETLVAKRSAWKKWATNIHKPYAILNKQTQPISETEREYSKSNIWEST